MEREIKFRGQRIDNNEWVYGYVGRIQEDDSSFTYLITEDTTRHQRNVRSVTFEVKPESVGQYTGLKDKNGVEIYEGDVCKNDECVGFVRFDYGWAIDYKSHSHDMPQYYCDRLEIIGSIHTNPELLNNN